MSYTSLFLVVGREKSEDVSGSPECNERTRLAPISVSISFLFLFLFLWYSILFNSILF